MLRCLPSGPSEGLISTSFWRGRRARALGFPVAIQGPLHLHEPYDGRDDEDAPWEEPEARPSGDGRLLPASLVHVPDLGRDHEAVDRRQKNLDDERDHTPDAVAGVLPHLVARLVGPVPAVEVERDDVHHDSEADAARLTDWARLALHPCLLAHAERDDPAIDEPLRERAGRNELHAVGVPQEPLEVDEY